MLKRLARRIAGVVRSVVSDARSALAEALRPAAPAFGLVTDLARPRKLLIAENAMLRQQPLVLRRQVKRPRFTVLHRIAMVAASAFAGTWRDTLLLVKPATVLRWHRQGFRLFWRWKSRKRRGHPRLSCETIELIKRLARDNVLCGAERIRGELLKLGIRVAKRTIQKYTRATRGRPQPGQRWATFLKNHEKDIWACDFIQTYDFFFRPIVAFFIVKHDSREVVHVAVTRSPTQTWTAQQLRNATPFGHGPRFITRDRDAKFGADFDRAAKGVGYRVIKTAALTPNMNAICERYLGSVRRECLDHVIILSERHLLSVLTEYVDYFNRSRPHQCLQQRPPKGQEFPIKTGNVVAFPVLGGLHHDYRRAA